MTTAGDEIGAFLAAFAPLIAGALGDLTREQSVVCLRDATGDVVAPATEDVLSPGRLLQSLVAAGPSAAAHVTYLPGRSEVVAHVLLGDGHGHGELATRRAPVRAAAGGVELGPWWPGRG